MNEMNSLEAQLHSWQPRRPSARLKGRLFSKPVRRAPRRAWFVGWLVPATACALLTFSSFIPGNDLSARSGRGPMLSNHQDRLTPVSDNCRPGENNMLSVTFDLTNHNGVSSTMSALQSARTN